MSPNNTQITHKSGQFEYLSKGLSAILDYEINDQEMIITHTYVPDGIRGQGIAAQLVESALSYAQASNLKIIPKCSYVAAYIKR